MTRRSVPSKAQVRQWTVSHPAAAVIEVTAAPGPSRENNTGIRYGYTLAVLNDLARRAVRLESNWYPAGNRGDQYDAAWHGIAEHLCAADEPPTVHDLLNAGRAALQNDQYGHKQMIGARTGSTSTGANFVRYWDWHARPTPSPEDAVVNRIALGQIISTLPSSHLAALMTLAALDGDAGATAEALGITYSAVKSRLEKARRAFRTHWYAPDAPPRMHRPISMIPDHSWARLRETCVHGHAMTPENTAWEKPRKPGHAPVGRCRACERDRAIRRQAARKAGPA